MEKIRIGSLASVIDDNGLLWMSNVFFNGLFQMDLKERQIRCIGAFEGPDLSAAGLHRGAYINGTEIIFTPFYDRAIRIFHSDSNTYQTIAVTEECKLPFSKSIRIGNQIYFLSEDGCIWKYDIGKHKLEMDDLSAEYKSFRNGAKAPVTLSADADGFLMMQQNGNTMFRIDLVEHKTETISMMHAPADLEIPFYGGGAYWFFLSDSQDIISWNRETGEYTSYRCMEEKWGKEEFKVTPYAQMRLAGNDIWISNFNAQYPVRVDKENKLLVPVADIPEGFHIISPTVWGAIYSDIHFLGKNIYFIPCTGNLLLQYDRENGNAEATELALYRSNIPYIDFVLADSLKHNVALEGESIYAFDEFIRAIREDRVRELQMKEKRESNRGKQIWEFVLKNRM